MNMFKASAVIDADIKEVWKVLTQDLPRDPVPFGILKIEGAIEASGKLRLWSEVDPKRAFKLSVVEFEPPYKMTWRGGMPFGLFTGTRMFKLSELGQSIRFEMHEVFDGPLSGMISKTIPDLEPSFTKFAEALKSKAEQP